MTMQTYLPLFKWARPLTGLVNWFGTHENLFPNFYIINLSSIIGIQFLDGVGENIPVDNFGTVVGENPSCYGILP